MWPSCRPLPTLSEEGEQLLGNLPSMGRLFSSGLSGNFSELVKHPSFSSQIAKNPSFSSAVFSSLLSQRSEDQAMLVGCPVLPNPHTRSRLEKLLGSHPGRNIDDEMLRVWQPTCGLTCVLSVVELNQQ